MVNHCGTIRFSYQIIATVTEGLQVLAVVTEWLQVLTVFELGEELVALRNITTLVLVEGSDALLVPTVALLTIFFFFDARQIFPIVLVYFVNDIAFLLPIVFIRRMHVDHWDPITNITALSFYLGIHV